ncbi:hypothetical protein HYU10_00320 [Candidatus Woesearchaeota archaeon]|nr:hypothetical protein [Candidatus Woesearchaeota archaeon]
MALSDEEFYKLYQSSPHVKKIVDDVQRKYHAHKEQENEPGYDPGNNKWWPEAKAKVQKIIDKNESNQTLEERVNEASASDQQKVIPLYQDYRLYRNVGMLLLAMLGLPYLI